jgi:hypothetical protein
MGSEHGECPHDCKRVLQLVVEEESSVNIFQLLRRIVIGSEGSRYPNVGVAVAN